MRAARVDETAVSKQHTAVPNSYLKCLAIGRDRTNWRSVAQSAADAGVFLDLVELDDPLSMHAVLETESFDLILADFDPNDGRAQDIIRHATDLLMPVIQVDAAHSRTYAGPNASEDQEILSAIRKVIQTEAECEGPERVLRLLKQVERQMSGLRTDLLLGDVTAASAQLVLLEESLQRLKRPSGR